MSPLDDDLLTMTGGCVMSVKAKRKQKKSVPKKPSFGDIVIPYLERFPRTPTKTLSNLIYKENVECFNDPEHCRRTVRYYRGQSGKKDRKDRAKMKGQKYFKKGSLNPFSKLPKGLKHFQKWKSHKITGKKTLVLADAHIPYHDKEPLQTALEYGSKEGIDTILILGDFVDFHSVSFWETDPRERDIQKEILHTNYTLDVIREGFPDAKIIYKIGNHEERLERYLKVKAPELLGMEVLGFDNIFNLQEREIQLVSDMRIITIGRLNIIHGHEFRKSFFNPVNPARGLFLRGTENSLCAHYHQTSQHTKRTMGDNIISTWSVGCLCNLRPDYAPLNDWNHGLAVIERSGSDFQVHNKKIIKGKVY
jgi:predicted phosphodiesterase